MAADRQFPIFARTDPLLRGSFPCGFLPEPLGFLLQPVKRPPGPVEVLGEDDEPHNCDSDPGTRNPRDGQNQAGEKNKKTGDDFGGLAHQQILALRAV